MDIHESYSLLKSQYETNVKPHIDEGEHLPAYMGMMNLIIGCLEPDIAKFVRYHSGPMCFATAQTLTEKLKKRDLEGIATETKAFEAYLAQLGLSIKSKNKF